jgi:hypothetical protein|nr:MAG TPA: hypothetical protein [Caudoviricetes sp.]
MSIYNKSAFDITLDVLGWGVKTIYKGGKAAVETIADNLPTEANKNRKREEEYKKTMDNLEAARRSVTDAIVAGRRNDLSLIETSIADACFECLYEQDELLQLVKKINTYDPSTKIMGATALSITSYDDLPIKTYKDLFDFKDEAKRVLSELEILEEKRREDERLIKIANDEFTKLIDDLCQIPNFKTFNAYKVNYKHAISASNRISKFLEDYPHLESKNADRLITLLNFANSIIDINKHRIELDNQEEQNALLNKIREDHNEQVRQYQATINKLKETIEDLQERLDDSEREAKDARDELEANDGSLSTAILTGMVIADHR